MYRSILAGIFALFTVILVSCGSPQAKAPPTYSAEQISQLQSSASRLVGMRDRMDELGKLIEAKNWPYVDMFIHGPLGTLREQTSRISRNLLLPSEQQNAAQMAKDLFNHLEDIDAAANADDYYQAVRNYNESLADFDAFLNLIPSADSAS
ncbi:MAG: photosystem II protein PsbQ [Geitlerinemataceae cyanobacterium]